MYHSKITSIKYLAQNDILNEIKDSHSVALKQIEMLTNRYTEQCPQTLYPRKSPLW